MAWVKVKVVRVWLSVWSRFWREPKSSLNSLSSCFRGSLFLLRSFARKSQGLHLFLLFLSPQEQEPFPETCFFYWLLPQAFRCLASPSEHQTASQSGHQMAYPFAFQSAFEHRLMLVSVPSLSIPLAASKLLAVFMLPMASQSCSFSPMSKALTYSSLWLFAMKPAS